MPVLVPLVVRLEKVELGRIDYSASASVHGIAHPSPRRRQPDGSSVYKDQSCRPSSASAGRCSVPLAVQILGRERTLTLEIRNASVFAGECAHLRPGGHHDKRAR